MYVGEHGNYTATHCSCCGEAFLVRGTGVEGMEAARSALNDHVSQSDKCEEYYDKLPTLDDLRGIAPDCTGTLSSEDFVRKIRGGNYADSAPDAWEAERVWAYLDTMPRDRYCDPAEDVIAITKPELTAALDASRKARK